MKSMKDIMSELGFNKDAPVDTQKAFIKNLIAAAKASEAPRVSPLPILAKETPTKVEESDVANTKIHKSKKQKNNTGSQAQEQLEFDFSTSTRVS